MAMDYSAWMTRTLIIAALITALAGVGFWLSKNRAVQSEYADALALCESDKKAGAAKVAVLDELHGIDRRPSALQMDIALCALRSSVDDYVAAKKRLDALE